MQIIYYLGIRDRPSTVFWRLAVEWTLSLRDDFSLFYCGFFYKDVKHFNECSTHPN